MIAEARKELAKILDEIDGLKVHTSVPGTVYPPACLVVEETPFITVRTFNQIDLEFGLILLVAPRPGNKAAELAELDKLVAKVFSKLYKDFAVACDSYQTFNLANSQPLLGAKLNITIPVEI